MEGLNRIILWLGCSAIILTMLAVVLGWALSTTLTLLAIVSGAFAVSVTLAVLRQKPDSEDSD